MAVQTPEPHRSAAPNVALPVAAFDRPPQQSDPALAGWREMSAALSPIIGRRGVAALFQRCLHLRQHEYPGLAAAIGEGAAAVGDGDRDDLAGLGQLLQQQSPAQARLTNAALLQTFTDLLVEMIGAALTKRLIGGLPSPAKNGLPVQDARP